MWTKNNGVFRCTAEVARQVAEDAGLREERIIPRDALFWEDYATQGGGCRIVWRKGIAWVSCHSGYPYADITNEVSEFFLMYGAENLDSAYRRANPFINPEDNDKLLEYAEQNPWDER
jgi:hypothetical protein